jgi:uncharacterized protein YndB with AHSA1/START domain
MPTTGHYSDADGQPRIRFHFEEHDYPDMTGEIREVAALERFVFTWGDDELQFELMPADEGQACRLAFTVALDAADKAARDGAGWEACLDALGLVAGGQRPVRPMPTDAWQEHYAEYQRRGFPVGAEIPESHG